LNYSNEKRQDSALTRREFLYSAACAGTCLLFLQERGLAAISTRLKEASYYHRTGKGTLVCNLCPNECSISDGALSSCRTRLNRHGKLYTLSYDSLAAIHKDPIGKGPLYHFLPGASALSVATAGCNLRCLYCQNWSSPRIPPRKVRKIDISQEDIIKKALRNGCRAITFTYTEPVAYYEYMIDIARRAKSAGLATHMATAAYINKEPLEELCRHMDAATVALKGFNDPFYKKICGCPITPVLDAIVTMKRAGVWLEIATCIVPTLNDNAYELKRMARWIRDSLGADTPFHLVRFLPEYRLANLPPTPTSVMEDLRKTALDEGLRYVYISNMPGHEGNNTYCPSCGKAVITRLGFKLISNYLKRGRCPNCGAPIPVNSGTLVEFVQK